ncbi:MAG: beta strand repeat-containing protein, partial [Gemmatimonadaceae bacterium]
MKRARALKRRAGSVLRAITFAVASLVGMSSTAEAQLWVYSVDQANIRAIGPGAGLPTVVRAGLIGGVKASLAQRASDGVLYFFAGTAGNDSVFTWNPNTPAAAPVFLGRTGVGIPYLPRLTFDAAGVLHALNTGSTQRYIIDQTTGAATAAGAVITGMPTGGGDMAFAPNGTLYAVVGTTIFPVPLAGGAVTGNALTGITGTVTGAAFDRQGRLLVSSSAGSSVIYVAPLAGGATTSLGAQGFDIGDLGSILAVDLRITKTHTGNFVQGQTNAQYVLTVFDSGNVATTGTVTVTDTLPAGLTPTAATGTGWTCGIAGQIVTCTRSNSLASGASYPTITITSTVSGTAPATVTNRAWVSGGGQPTANALMTANDVASDPTTIDARTDLIIDKTHTGNFTVGVNGVYSIPVTNQGSLASVGTITVIDTLPAGLGFVSGTGGGFTCGAVGQIVTCTRATALAPSTTVTITLTVSVAAAAAPSVTNRAWVSGGGEPANLNGNNGSGDDPTVVIASANLGITKTDGLTGVNQGSALTYTIVASNAGPNAVVAATVTDNFPANITVSGWTCAASVGSVCPASGAGNIAALVNLLNGGTATFTVNATATGAGTITNTATIAVPVGAVDPTPANNTATDNNTVITPTANLAIVKSDGVTAVNQGGALVYTITASNAGPSTATGATVTDVFPANVTVGAWTCTASAGSSCPASGSGNLAAAVTLLSGGTATFTVNATATGAGTITNTATITAPVGINDPAGNNTSTDNNTVITPTADLSISKTDGLTGVNQGGTVTYTIIASNAGP